MALISLQMPVRNAVQRDSFSGWRHGPRRPVKRAAGPTRVSNAEVDSRSSAIERALTAKRPKARYLVGRDARTMAGASRALPAKVYDRLVRRTLKLP